MSRLTETLAAIDDANSKDPNTTLIDGKQIANELLYSQRMTHTLKSFCPNASELLQIAAHAQHIERWKSPRSDYPEGRSGYKKWRAELGLFHGQRAGEIMATHGYSESDIDRVKFLLQKRQLKRDPETQTLEDVICLVFLEHYFESFANKHDEQKLIDIVQKTWKKMSESGQKSALTLNYSDKISQILKKSLP